jgi:hypothetical protein
LSCLAAMTLIKPPWAAFEVYFTTEISLSPTTNGDPKKNAFDGFQDAEF